MTDTFAQKITAITTCGLEKKDLHGIVEVLEKLSEQTDSCGCVLWETDPWANVSADQPSGNLHVFARWMCDKIEMPLKELPINDSAIGKALIKQEIVTKDDVRVDLDTFKGNNWIFDIPITSICAVPIKFDSEEYNATLCVYRRDEIRPFSGEEQSFIKQVAELIPPLYQAVRNHVGQELLSEINKILEEADRRAKDREIELKALADADENNKKGQSEADEFKEINDGLEEICVKVAKVFQCIETSIFLRNRSELGNKFKLRATNYKNWTVFKEIYDPEIDQDHLTGWVLKKQQAINVFDLGNFERDKEKLREKYEDNNINWKDSLDIRQAASRIIPNVTEDNLPTLSFMAVPIKKGDELLGVIRCSTAFQDPWFFAERQLKILELVAAQISRFWSEWMQHLEEKREIRKWEEFIKAISKLNAKAERRIGRSEDDKNKLYAELSLLTENSIKNSNTLEIRLRDEKTNELYYVKPVVSSKYKRGNEEVARRHAKRFSLDQLAYSKPPFGVIVFGKKEASIFSRAEFDDVHFEMFPDTKQILIAPIGVQEDIRGVLDIHNMTNEPFPPHALQMATLLGQQLGLYLSLWESEAQQRQVLEDIWHQLKNPVRHIYKRANDLLNDVESKSFNSEKAIINFVATHLLRLRGVARKAKRVAVNASIFKDLATEGKIKVVSYKKTSLKTEEVVKMLIEAGIDTRLLLEEGEDVLFNVIEESFKPLNQISVKVNFDLLEQSVNCLFDNAAKYSLSGTRVETRGGIESHKTARYFYISVRNHGYRFSTDEGYRITEDEVNELKKRYYRGERAQYTTGEGSGIGLWVVDHIMSAHGGKLEIIQTNFNGWNEVRLLFPVSS